MTANGYGVSFKGLKLFFFGGGDENCYKIRLRWLHNPVNILKTTELDTGNWVNCMARKLFPN